MASVLGAVLRSTVRCTSCARVFVESVGHVGFVSIDAGAMSQSLAA